MRLRLPGSLAGRLVAVASMLIALAILLACLAMGFALHRFVTGQIDQRLDAQALAIASALRPAPGGRIALAAAFDAPPFDRKGSGWYWRVEGPDGVVASSRALRPRDALASISNGDSRRRDRHATRPPDAPQPAEAVDGTGRKLHARQVLVTFEGRALTILVTAPRQAIDGALREAVLPVVVAMAVLAAALLAAIRIQVRLGLKPLDRLRRSLSDVRAGRALSVPADQPREIAPLAAELNTLLDENAEGLVRARRHVANLAHGLKTPLADLALTLREAGRDPGGEASALVEAMDRRVRHHLARARAAAAGKASRAATPLKPHVDDLVAVLGRIHAARALRFAVDVPDGTVVACEPQDLDEMLGNLLDNACKWGRTTVTVGVVRTGATARIAIDDDGTGIDPDRLPEALRPGGRLDEMTPGHGFGLSITRELAELYGGGVDVGTSAMGGFAVGLTLPISRG